MGRRAHSTARTDPPPSQVEWALSPTSPTSRGRPWDGSDQWDGAHSTARTDPPPSQVEWALSPTSPTSRGPSVGRE
ncbi:hypothetical protein GCM10027053_34630 [Intrasporangium mesophilum]